jgi:DNA-binding transcriptional ArsR family regulator
MESKVSVVLDEGIAAQVADFFSAFGDTSRVRIISALMGGRMHVGAIASVVEISASAVSHHLRGLRQLRLVKTHKEGRQVFYYLDDEHIINIFESGVNHVQHD